LDRFDFLRSTNFILLNQINKNVVNYCDVLNFIISVEGDPFDCSLFGPPKRVTTPLNRNKPKYCLLFSLLVLAGLNDRNIQEDVEIYGK
jgi:hypothetical protein